jgi:hypothetical protein
MNLNGAVDEVELPVNNDEVYVHNSWTDSIPTVIHGNGPAKVKNFFIYLSLFS